MTGKQLSALAWMLYAAGATEEEDVLDGLNIALETIPELKDFSLSEDDEQAVVLMVETMVDELEKRALEKIREAFGIGVQNEY